MLSSLLFEKRNIPDVTRDHVQFFFESFRNGDISSTKYQKTLIKHFLRAVYLYNDHIKITFDYDDSDTGVEIPIADDDSSAENNDETSVLIDSLGLYHFKTAVPQGFQQFFLFRDPPPFLCLFLFYGCIYCGGTNYLCRPHALIENFPV